MATVSAPRKGVNIHTCRFPADETAAALRAALAAAPGDAAAAAALGDRYRELGYADRTADAWVRRTVRFAELAALLAGSGAKSGRLRSYLRGRCGVRSCPVALVGYERRDQAPTVTGEPPRHEFRGGGECKYPGAAMRAGYKVDYVADTRAVTVGVKWLADRLEEACRG